MQGSSPVYAQGTIRLLRTTGCAALACALVGSLARAQGTPDFAPRIYSAVPEVRGVELEDLDGDGFLDALATQFVSNGQLVVARGKGLCGFAAPSLYPLGGYAPLMLARADFNQDGHTDVVANNIFLGTVSVVLGDGQGAFGAPLVIQVGVNPESIATADFDRDGNEDIVIGRFADPGNVTLLYGDGQGGFGAPVHHSTGDMTYDLGVGDLNLDGNPDILAGHSHMGFAVLLGDGSGGFTQLPFVLSFAIGHLQVGFVDHDPFPDVVVVRRATGSSGIDVHRGHGDGTFDAPIAFPTTGQTAHVVLGDLNGDGHVDAVTADEFSNNVSILLGDGTGNFAPSVSYPGGGGLTSVALGDVDLDGHIDVVGACQGGFTLLSGDGTGAFRTPTQLALLPQPRSPVAADLDNDGDLDVVTGSFLATWINVLKGDGAGTFSSPLSYGTVRDPRGIAVGRWNGDAFLDVAVAEFYGNSVSFYINDGTGGFLPAVAIPVGGRPYEVAMGDLDGDLDDDVVSADFLTNNISVLLGDGNGGITSNTSLVVGAAPSAVALGDMDGDSHLDVVVTKHYGKDVSVLLGDGAGGFSAPLSRAIGMFPIDVAVGDLDQDGKLDVVVASKSSQFLSFFRGLGDGNLAPQVPLALPAYPAVTVEMVDVNSDGRLDVAAVCPGRIVLFLGDGAGGVSTLLQVACPSDSADVTIADFDGDGRQDLFTVSNYPSLGSFYSNAGMLSEPATYCAAKRNSQGCLPRITSMGEPSASATTSFVIGAQQVLNKKPGLLIHSPNAASTPFQGGLLCLGPPVKRTPLQSSGGNIGAPDCSGSFALDFNAYIQSGLAPWLVAGADVYAQYISRDPADPFGWSLTDGLAFTICP